MYRIPIYIAADIVHSPEQLPSLADRLAQDVSKMDTQDNPSSNVRGIDLISSHGKVRFICDYISAHYQEEISLESLSEIAFIHPDYLSRIFKKETGMNLNRYIKTVRMNKACQLLLTTQQRVSAISNMVGYQNCAYFIRTFTETFGTSPEKYRQKQAQKKEGDTNSNDQ